MKRFQKAFCIFLTMTVLLGLCATAVFAAEVKVDSKEGFQAAINDSTATKVTFTANVDLTDLGVVDVDGLVIDLGGHTVSADNFSLIFQGTDFTIQNGKMSSNGGAYALFIGDDGTTDRVLVQNVTFEGGVNVYNATNVVLRNVNVGGTHYYAVWCDEGAEVTIESGTFSTEGAAVLGMASGTDVGVSMQVEGGKFETNGKPLVLEGSDSQGNAFNIPVISGGSFDAELKEEWIAEGFVPVQKDDGTYGVASTSDGEEETVKYTIEAEAGEGGSISPNGEYTTREGNSKNFVIKADSGYRIQDVLVDGESVGAVNEYMFADIDDDHTIEAIFEKGAGASSGAVVNNPSTGAVL